MKKLLLFFGFIALLIPAKAQLPAFSLGPKIGYNANSLSFSRDSVQSGLQNAFQCGAFVRVGRKLYLQPEVNYQVKGGVFEGDRLSPSGLQKVTLNTITVPVLVGYHLVNGGPINLRVMAGPTMSFVINKKLDEATGSTVWPIRSSSDIKNSLWSFQMGGGVDIFFLTLDVRYEVGLTNIYTGSDNFKLKNNIFNVSLGVKLL